MDIQLRPGRPGDAAALGVINFEAFRSISDKHGFPWDFPSAEAATGLATMLLNNPGFYCVVAEEGGRALGSNFMDERGPVAGIGPISVDPAVQNQTVGRRLMLDALARAEAKGFAAVRLLQAAYHNRSLCLYTKLGFETRETISKIGGTPPRVRLDGYHVRPAEMADLDACNQLCFRVHGHDRGGELRDAVADGTARVVEHLGRITAYCSDIGFFAHAVAETNEGLQALIGSAEAFGAGAFLLPTRNGAMFRWCLGHGLTLVHQMTLMTIGPYNEPSGAYLPSILY